MSAAALLFALAVTRAQYRMGTVCEITADPARIDAAFAEAGRIEAMLSTWTETSELARLNRGEITRVSPELHALLQTAMEWSAKTGNAFNPLVHPLIDAWRTREEGAVPDAERIREALRAMGKVRFEGDAITGAQFEEGAFGKGYAIDRLLATIGGDAVINFGGQLASTSPIEVTIADPNDRTKPVVALTLRGSLSTSSCSEKSFVVNGRTFSHLLDPRTGQALPPRGSVSVLHDSALVADILSTALYVMGPADGLAWARAHGVTAIFITDSREILVSQPLRLTLLDAHYRLKD